MTRVAVVSGAGAGIGTETAFLLAREGRQPVLLDSNADALEKTARRIADAGFGRAACYVLDTTRADDVAKVFARIRSEVGRVEILVNCVGGSSPPTPVDELQDAPWREAFALNVDGTFFCTRAAVGDMKKARWGRIVNLSSVAGRTRTLFGGVQYAAAKAAVIGFTRQCAFELGAWGITANVVAPGVTLSERVERRWNDKEPAERERILGLIPLGRAGSCDEVAHAVVFLCSEASSYITGATLDANGGIHIG
jgi:NAD(P)-dependent dehydrogenase (short-subunit alcohol dehydrogenase family)